MTASFDMKMRLFFLSESQTSENIYLRLIHFRILKI